MMIVYKSANPGKTDIYYISSHLPSYRRRLVTNFEDLRLTVCKILNEIILKVLNYKLLILNTVINYNVLVSFLRDLQNQKK